jgi:hypothetical protein
MKNTVYGLLIILFILDIIKKNFEPKPTPIVEETEPKPEFNTAKKLEEQDLDLRLDEDIIHKKEKEDIPSNNQGDYSLITVNILYE